MYLKERLGESLTATCIYKYLQLLLRQPEHFFGGSQVCLQKSSTELKACGIHPIIPHLALRYTPRGQVRFANGIKGPGMNLQCGKPKIWPTATLGESRQSLILSTNC